MERLRSPRFLKVCMLLLLLALFPLPLSRGADETVVPPPLPEETLPGVSLAQGISQMTGVAISPLLGVSAIGAWKYWRTDASKRHLLPWFCKPLFWGIGLSILALIFLKDSIGAGAPPFVKKPLDLLELFESKFSAVIASTAFVPFVARQMELHFSEEHSVNAAASAVGSTEMLASVPLAFSMHWLFVPICVFGFLMVWVVSHAINVLILLSPFGLIDAFLKSCRIFLLSSIAVLYAIHPALAAAVSLAVIVIAAILAPAAFRLSVFGTIMSIDYVASIFRKEPAIRKVHCFLAKRGSKRMKVRTFGWVERNPEGRLAFHSKFLFVGPTRSLVLPDTEEFSITRGMIFPSLSMVPPGSEDSQLIVNLLPRFRGQVEEAAAHLQIVQILDSPVTRGVKAMFRWLKETLKAGRDKLIDVASDVADTVSQKRLPPPPAA